MKLILAPLQGLTDKAFRNAWAKHFTGIDEAVSPFISLSSGAGFRKRDIKEIAPNDQQIPLIPQVLGTDPDQFINLNRQLSELGYKQINWNLGCPMPQITKKKRGSGLLPYPETIREILEKVIPANNVSLSVKIRLGHISKDEFRHLLPVLNDFPLENITIHPRTATQRYEGVADINAFGECLRLTSHQVVYNGDICNAGFLQQLQNRFTTITHWMVGRGLLYNPFLAEQIKGIDADGETRCKERFLAFHKELYGNLKQQSDDDHKAFNRMKGFWKYFMYLFEDGQTNVDQILHLKQPELLEEKVLRLVMESDVKNK